MRTLTLARIVGASVLAALGAMSSGCAETPRSVATNTATSTAANLETDPTAEPAIRDLLHRYETALNGNDTDTILALYGADPVFMPQHSSALVGRDAVRAGYQHVFDTLKLDIRFEVYEVHVDGDWAWARTSSAGRTKMLAANAVVEEGNNELFVFRRERSEWKIHRYLFSTTRPHA